MSDLVLARNCCLARMLPGEALSGPTDWIMRYIKTTIFTVNVV